MNQLCSTLKDQNFSPVTGSLFFFIWRGFTFYKHKMSALTIIITSTIFKSSRDLFFRGQVSFPGGNSDKTDTSPVDTALRSVLII